MKGRRKPANTIDDYIDGFPADVQLLLQKIRTTIKKAAPQAEEAIKYQIPAFTFHGNLIFFAAFKNHIGLYPAPRGAEEFKRELAAYEGGKGTVQFPLDKPIPFKLIARMTKFRLKQNLERAEMKRKKR